MAQKKILVMDDDKDFLEELKEALVQSCYDVTGVSDASLALKKVESVKPDLILLDLRMPSISGFEIASKLNSSVKSSRIPVIAMTGYYTMKERDYLMSLCDIKKCFMKPFNLSELIEEIERILD